MTPLRRQKDKKLREIGPLRIETLANGGSGIARLNGQVVFVPKTVPGDLIRCRVVKQKKAYLQAELLELLEPAVQRCTPPCPVADECGGCQWQQMPYPEQLFWKAKLFRETLQRQCDIQSDRILPIVAAPAEWGYRSRTQVKCYFSGGRFQTGFFRSKSRIVVPIDACPLLPDSLNALMRALRKALEQSRFVKQVSQLDLAVGANDRCQALVHYLGSEVSSLVELLRPLAEQQGFDLLLQTGRKESIRLLHGRDSLPVQVDEPALELSYQAGSFAQINLEQNQQLVAAVIAAAELQGTEQVFDLYCGMGNFSLPLARRAASLFGIEDYSPSIVMAKRNAALNNINNVKFYSCPAEEFPRYGQADLLLLDPPRSGAYPLTQLLLDRPVPRILYVSCDPQTLARDIKPLLQSNYSMVSSQPFDMFPHSYHVESLTVLDYLP